MPTGLVDDRSTLVAITWLLEPMLTQIDVAAWYRQATMS